MKPTHRIRRCNGNRDAWMLVALDDNGNEMLTHGAYTTALSIDLLLRHSGGLLPDDTDLIQLVYFSKD